MRVYVLALGIALAIAGSIWSSVAGAETPAACTPTPATICGTFVAVPVREEAPFGIVYNPSGALAGLWFTNATRTSTSAVVSFLPNAQKTIRYRTPASGSHPGSINYAPDGDLWFTETHAGKIATIDASHLVREFELPTRHGGPVDITRGPDGAMWFVETAAGKIGRITSTGAIEEFVSGAASSEPTSLITGPDRALWYTEVGTDSVGRLTTAGAVRHYAVGPERLSGGLTDATDALWFSLSTRVGRLTVDGTLTKFDLPDGVFATGCIFGAKLGGVYVGVLKRDGTGAMVRVSGTGKTTEFDLPQRNLLPIEMAQTAEGAFWMTVSPLKKNLSRSVLYELR
jgi:virginiamycin B lyase